MSSRTVSNCVRHGRPTRYVPATVSLSLICFFSLSFFLRSHFSDARAVISFVSTRGIFLIICLVYWFMYTHFMYLLIYFNSFFNNCILFVYCVVV